MAQEGGAEDRSSEDAGELDVHDAMLTALVEVLAALRSYTTRFTQRSVIIEKQKISATKKIMCLNPTEPQ